MSGAIHATAIVTGTTGLLIVGPSGSGKSRLALNVVAEARRLGQFGMLVADDRVFIDRHGDHLVARRPASIMDMIEVRGSGIARLDSMEKAVLHWAVRVIVSDQTDRLPDDNERHHLSCGGELPVVRLTADCQAPFTTLQGLFSHRSQRMGENLSRF